ncbi:TylF/MycF/NovP-related O-methyltransferase [Telluribacter sp. SYSU D00476]|uniref:TylF/MycF/NovP-related O-methyltransferase n=1 Tax=Telluribacter sp. SYSU D00476 TaxID=2811430 RepID=UPI001FF27742|nr:TylF/MycF/NovP-related O-methyltransferase [Telluribacter sp. SYSU D00476]
MKNYTVNPDKKWDYENGFYLTCETNRIGKLLNHLDVYHKILDLPGDILEFGVYKGTSLVRLLSFRNLLENEYVRKVYGFDMFGKFPDALELESDRSFVEKFESAGGYGISSEELEMHLTNKGFINFSLVQGDILLTLPDFLAQNPALKIALLHIDVDVYEPTKFILENLWERVVKGGVVMLDDYGTVEGETRAVDEFFEDMAIQIHKPRFNYIPSYIIKP